MNNRSRGNSGIWMLILFLLFMILLSFGWSWWWMFGFFWIFPWIFFGEGCLGYGCGLDEPEKRKNDELYAEKRKREFVETADGEVLEVIDDSENRVYYV